jgi:hypothetical protein
LAGVIQKREDLAAALGQERDSSIAVANWWRDSAKALEAARAAGQLTVRQLRTVASVQAELRSSFPELGDTVAWGSRGSRSSRATRGAR